ncbi:hypothetical protein BKA64DRAFT_639641 [Cadophora sp. MPI-SDFR-AT-0126]|nr:hypothetical protein BKA64DRAFT_639641 [Leotiomycetes sp. MPI-SDFR-AT-0126]
MIKHLVRSQDRHPDLDATRLYSNAVMAQRNDKSIRIESREFPLELVYRAPYRIPRLPTAGRPGQHQNFPYGPHTNGRFLGLLENSMLSQQQVTKAHTLANSLLHHNGNRAGRELIRKQPSSECNPIIDHIVRLNEIHGDEGRQQSHDRPADPICIGVEMSNSRETQDLNFLAFAHSDRSADHHYNTFFNSYAGPHICGRLGLANGSLPV